MHPFFAAMAKQISNRLRTKGYGVAIAYSEENTDIERHEISTFLGRRVDALIIASTQRTGAIKTFKRIEDEGIPYVLADRMMQGLRAHFVGSDNRAIGPHQILRETRGLCRLRSALRSCTPAERSQPKRTHGCDPEKRDKD